jgi:hypothetical protein
MKQHLLILPTLHFFKTFLILINQNHPATTYIEVTFSNTTSDRRPIIHGAGDKTNYVDIDFTRTAEPLPDDSVGS